MSQISINRNDNDVFYRYKMDRVTVQFTGRGNGCFTIIDNINTIASQLNTPGTILMNYIGIVLSSNITNNRINGHHSASVIQNIIYSYIDTVILCNHCNIPELIPHVTGERKKKTLNLKCTACGDSYIAIGGNKSSDKLIDNIIKYYTNNAFIPIKGNNGTI